MEAHRHAEGQEAGGEVSLREEEGRGGGNTWREMQSRTWAHLEKSRRKEREAKSRRKMERVAGAARRRRDSYGERGKEGQSLTGREE